jgi:hypothetical protein
MLHMTFIGTICTKACLAPHKRVIIHSIHEVVPQAAATISFSCGSPSAKAAYMQRHVILFKINDSIEDSI